MIATIKPEGAPAIKYHMPNETSPEVIDRTIGQSPAGLLDGRGARYQGYMTSFDNDARCTAMRMVTDNRRSITAEITYHDDETEVTTC